MEQERLHEWAVTIRVDGGGKSITSNDRSPLMQGSNERYGSGDTNDRIIMGGSGHSVSGRRFGEPLIGMCDCMDAPLALAWICSREKDQHIVQILMIRLKEP